MQTRTHLNGGDASLQAVAEAWKKEDHDFHWSESAADKWAVELGHRLHDSEQKAGPAKPDPRNVHH
jgi:hypothetical protein